MPRVVGTTMHEVAASFSAVSRAEVVGLIALWAAGLYAHSFVLTGALPGLTRRRALTLNLTGSAVANVLPFGGAAAMGLNYVMVRSWAVSATGFASYTLVTNVWVVLLKLVMPMVALGVLAASGAHVNHSLGLTATGAALGLALVVATLLTGLMSRPRAARGAKFLAGAATRLARLTGRRLDRDALAEKVVECRDVVADVVRRSGGQMSAGMVAYAALQAALLWAALQAVGAGVTLPQALAGFAVDRLLTLAVFTPGGLGVTEAGTAATLVAFGGSPAAVAAGVLLYRGFTFAIEIPVGGTWLGGWVLTRRLKQRRLAQVVVA
jgi:uncharacterized membrane protein YbhN (UPF0104 family)